MKLKAVRSKGIKVFLNIKDSNGAIIALRLVLISGRRLHYVWIWLFSSCNQFVLCPSTVPLISCVFDQKQYHSGLLYIECDVVLDDVERSTESRHLDSHPVMTAFEVVSLETVVPETIILNGCETKLNVLQHFEISMLHVLCMCHATWFLATALGEKSWNMLHLLHLIIDTCNAQKHVRSSLWWIGGSAFSVHRAQTS